MFKSRYARFMFAPDTGADSGAGVSTNGADGANDGNGEVDNTDYKALYEKAIADSKKLKASFDQTSHEVAELKKAQKAKMSEEEQRQAEFEEKEQRYQEAMARVAEMETSTLFAENGFDKKDYEEVSKKIVEVGGDKARELADTIIEFVKKANKTAVASARNGAIKDGAIPPKTSTAKAGTQEKSDYQLYQESKTKTESIVNL